eukprot:8889052-Alexandrium_andersonii.AAC.1
MPLRLRRAPGRRSGEPRLAEPRPTLSCRRLREGRRAIAQGQRAGEEIEEPAPSRPSALPGLSERAELEAAEDTS